jgi:hypothetical protein
MGKSTINWQFSIAMFVYQRVIVILAEKYLRHKEGTSFHETLVFRNSSTDGEEKIGSAWPKI